jgi:hypothetical protein
MTKTNLKANHIRIENLYKSMFSEIENTYFKYTNNHIEIAHIDLNNQDAALVEITETESGYVISYWDGYSLSEIEECDDLIKAQKIFKRFAKKLAKNLNRFSRD